METILIIYQQYNVHFHLKQDSDLKIPLNGLKMDQLDQIWFQIKRKISFKLTWKIAAEFILELLPLTSPKIKLCREKTAQKIFFKTTYSNSEWFHMRFRPSVANVLFCLGLNQSVLGVVKNVAFFSLIFHPYSIKIKAMFKSFEFGKNLKILSLLLFQNSLHFQLRTIRFLLLNNTPPFGTFSVSVS